MKMTEAPADLIHSWLQRQLPEPAWSWFEEQLAGLVGDPSDRKLHIVLGMIPRRLGKDDLRLDDGDLAVAEAARPGWDPRGWSVDEAARILALCETGGAGAGSFAARFKELCRTAEVGELIALYRGLPLYGEQDSLVEQAGEGLRTNMRAVFEAVAHGNPFPRERFDQNRWNQMVLKALFIGSCLHPIQGLDARANPELAAILCDYAHERWAAGRPVTPELWRCVGPFAEGAMLDDLERALSSDNEGERAAAALALAASPAPEARRMLAAAGPLAERASRGEVTWDALTP